jgi:hypothetical protein
MATEATSLSELRAQYEDFLRGEVRKDDDNDGMLYYHILTHYVILHTTPYSVTIS